MADNVDIFVILSGYVMMIGTFVSLYVNMRRMGSRYTLGKLIPIFKCISLLIFCTLSFCI